MTKDIIDRIDTAIRKTEAALDELQAIRDTLLSDDSEGQHWSDDIVAVMQRGRRYELPELYRLVEQRRRKTGRSLPVSTRSVIRNTLQVHSRDSIKFGEFGGGKNLFAHVEYGVWALQDR